MARRIVRGSKFRVGQRVIVDGDHGEWIQLQLQPGASPRRARLRLEAEVDEMGRSIRPSQIQHWIAEQQGVELELIGLSREVLQLS